MQRAAKFALVSLLPLPLVAAAVGTMMGSRALHPTRRPLTSELISQTDRMLERTRAKRENFEVRAWDGTPLRGWKARPEKGNGDWVLLFHGVSDNRVGLLGHAELLLGAGYSVLMMDARAHGTSEGAMATYGWLERHDTRTIADALYTSEAPHCLFALGESMGAAIALQSAAIEQRIVGVVAESPFANLREVSYDYAGLRMHHWLGKTLFRPAAYVALKQVEKEGLFKASEVSPEKAAAGRALPILLICGTRDRNIPCRHARRIWKAATGPKQLWIVPGGAHSATLGQAPAEFRRRVLEFYSSIHATPPPRRLVSESKPGKNSSSKD